MNIIPNAIADKSLKALQVYSKAAPEATYVEIENKMREDNFPLYTIAVVSLLPLHSQ